MDQCVLTRSASGAQTYDQRPLPRHDLSVVVVPREHRTQPQLQYVIMAKPVKVHIALAPASLTVSRANTYPTWVNLGSFLVTMLLLASFVAAFIDGHIAVGLAAIAFCGVWFFGNAAERSPPSQ